MNAAVTPNEPEVLTPEQEEAELQRLLDESDKRRFGEQEQEPAPADPPADKLVVEEEGDTEGAAAQPASEPASEPATEPARTAAVAEPAATVATPATELASKPAKPADSGKDTGTPATEPAKPAEPDGDDDNALLAQVPEGPAREALKNRLAREAEKRAKLEQDNRSMAGRVSAYQRRYEEATGKRQPAPEPVVTPAQKQEWKQFAEEFPEIAKAIEARFAESLPPGQAARTTELLQYVENQKRQQFLQDAWAAVDAVHPNWRAEGRTAEFQQWKESSSTYKTLAASDNLDDAIALFDLYEQHKARTKRAAPASATPPAPAAAANTAAADQVAARREKQVEGASAPSSKPASPNSSVDLNDEDQLFAFYAQQANARIGRRYK